MRTTVDLPDGLLRAAKLRAIERGESLKSLFVRALEHELGREASAHDVGSVVLPLIGRSSAPLRDVTNIDIEEALAADDAGVYDSR